MNNPYQAPRNPSGNTNFPVRRDRFERDDRFGICLWVIGYACQLIMVSIFFSYGNDTQGRPISAEVGQSTIWIGKFACLVGIVATGRGFAFKLVAVALSELLMFILMMISIYIIGPPF